MNSGLAAVAGLSLGLVLCAIVFGVMNLVYRKYNNED